MSKLVICEKPSVAKSFASALGVTSRADGYYEGNGYLVSWCIGHLVGLADATAYEAKLKKWRYDDLPILPKPFRYEVAPDKAAQFHILKKLMERPHVSELVNGCDAGREGELIFRLVYEMAGCTKPFSRLWISSMEDAAIREGFKSLRPGAEYDPLYQSALCRQKADWLIGINATRLFCVLYHRTLNVGRVQTPTLAMLAERDAKITLFQKEKYHHVRLALEDSLNRLQSRLFDITDTAPACLYFATMANSIGEGLELQMKDFISTHRDTRLIVVDTLQRIREEANDQNAYANDYRDLSFLKNIADQNSIAILLVHHTRKQRDRDPFNMISGTTALSGAADSSFILERVERGIKEATLTCVGRDIEDRVLRLKFDSETHIWKLLSDSVSEPLYKLPQAVSQVIERVKADGAFYGTATELLKQLCLQENLSPSVLSKQILRNLAVLEDEGICYESRRSGSRRAFSLTYHANDVNDGNDANLLSEPLPNFPSQASLPSRSLIAEPNQ